MLKFLKKLDRMAERFINDMDNDLGQPVVNMLNGDVFKDTTPQPAAPETPVLYIIDTPDCGQQDTSCAPAPVSDLTRDAVLA